MRVIKARHKQNLNGRGTKSDEQRDSRIKHLPSLGLVQNHLVWKLSMVNYWLLVSVAKLAGVGVLLPVLVMVSASATAAIAALIKVAIFILSIII